ncbi:MAG: hypothetical protein JW909_07500 [Planctomycetes bacterium]|nr:hypothetical protein [Planctomycetota bacterium]
MPRVRHPKRKPPPVNIAFLALCASLTFLSILSFPWLLDPTLPMFSKTDACRFPFLVVTPSALLCWIILYYDIKARRTQKKQNPPDGA